MNSKLLAAVVSLSIIACSGRTVDVGTDGPDETSSAVKSPKSAASGSSTSTVAPAPSSSAKPDAPDSDDDDGLFDASTPTDPTPDAGSDCTPSTSIRCVNGGCTCGAGPNQGKSCNGAISSGSSSCSVLCAFCD